ncbi:hypothetical protein FIBSPDRAFT_961016 [Athelia psychrophila]|uniref:Uncharacterized protein n=1 Tax=Athelia psychrophila TaxID=1759441 RepID=A0A166BTD4_9AGAM|nr:hypothetical protein FIBSPDRAFT_961016 [Fibularhizoctonia sp. CBS 109695]
MTELSIDPIPKDQVTTTKIGGVAKRYFSTWKAKYKEQVDPVQAAKRVQKDKDGRARDHRTAKWDPFQSPEHSNSGKAERINWEAERVRRNGGSSGLETRKVLFRATWLTRLFYALDKLGDAKAAPGKGKPHYERWHGLDINTVGTEPPFGKQENSHQCMYDPEWLAAQSKVKRPPLPTPADFELTKCQILDDEIQEENLKALEGL